MVEVRRSNGSLAGHTAIAEVERIVANGKGELVVNRRKAYVRLFAEINLDSAPMKLPRPRSHGGWAQRADKARTGVSGSLRTRRVGPAR